MTDESETCDRCDATIVYEGFRRPNPMHFAFQVDDGEDEATYHEETRTLCDACEDDLLEWIDEGDIDRSDCVDLPTALESVRTLERAANTLNQTAEVLREEHGDEHASE